MSDINPAEHERTVLHDLNELAFAMSEGRDPNLDTSELDRIGTFLNVMEQAVSVVREFREERLDVEARFSETLSTLAGGAGVINAGTFNAEAGQIDSSLQAGGELTETEKPEVNNDRTDSKVEAVESDPVIVETLQDVSDIESVEEPNPNAASSDGVVESAEVNEDVLSKHAGSRAVDWDMVEGVIVEVINGKAKGSELKQADFLAHPYFSEMIEAAGNSTRAKGQALRAARNVAEKGILTHNGKIKAASRWIVSAETSVIEQESDEQTFLAE